jgi:gluconolactonase
MRTLGCLLLFLSCCLLANVAKAEDNTPPDGFTALFNGKDLAGWKGLVGDPKSRAAMKPEELAEAQKKADASMNEHWKAVDGVIVFDGKGDSLCTAKDFGDFEMYVDWKIEEKGDSGIYLRGSPQVQIWDYKLNNIGSGGLYNNEKNPANPLVLADKPVGEWNTFYIKMVGDKVTVKLNDQVVVDDTVLENYWERDKPIYPTGQIELQNHGNSLYFKNIYIKELKGDDQASKTSSDSEKGFGEIRRLDPRLDAIVPAEAKMEKLAEGFEWSEGPVWVRDGEYLLFSDIPNNAVMKWKDGEGLSLFLKPAGYTGPANAASGEPGSNGLLVDKDGRLVLCEHGDRRIARLEKNGKKTTLADKYDGKRLNSPNDAAFKSNGDLYFTDPPYGLPRQDDPSRELDFCGVYRLQTDGTVTLLTDQMTRPNGIAFSPDEKTLYVAQSDGAAPIIKAFDVKEDGTIDADKGRIFFDAKKYFGKEPGSPDGLKVDVHGNVFATGPGGVWILAPDGTPLGLLATGQATANCGFGDDGSTLYITADMYLLRVKLTTKGMGF